MNDSTITLNSDLVLKSIPSLKSAATKGDRNALELLDSYSIIPGKIGIKALEALGELFCDHHVDIGNGIEKLRKAAIQGNSYAVEKLQGFLSSNQGHLRSSGNVASTKIHQFDFWRPILETYVANNATKKEFLSLIESLSAFLENDRVFAYLISSFFTGNEGSPIAYLKILLEQSTLLDKASQQEIIKECARILSDRACRGDEAALVLLINYYTNIVRLDREAIPPLLDQIIISLRGAPRYLALGLKAEAVGEAPWEYYQKGAFLGSATCSLKIIHLRLTNPQTDLEMIGKNLSQVIETDFCKSFPDEIKSNIKLFITRCNEARAVDKMVIRACNDTTFKDNAMAQSIILHYNKLGDWITKYSSLMTTN